MLTVGRFIGRGFSTVSGPFHPFGGAVDIVVVEQPDGSYKSSPWYVRFGKFQGVLKTREKVVSICVNGIEAGFHMYLDHTGEAYFLEEVEEIEVDFSSSGESKGELTKSQSCNIDPKESPLTRYGSDSSVTTVSGSKRSRLLGLVWGRKNSQDELSPEISRVTSLDRAEIVADLLDVNWSMELAIEKSKPHISLQLSECTVSTECNVDEDSVSESNFASLSAAGPLVQEPSGLISEVSQSIVELQIGDVRNYEQTMETSHIKSSDKLLETNSLHELATAYTVESLETRQSLESNGLVPQCEVKLINSNNSYYSLQNPRVSSSVLDDTMDCVQTAVVEESSSSILEEDVGLQTCHQTSSLKDTIHQSELDQSINAESHEDEQFLFSDDELKPDDVQKTSVSTSSSVDKELDTLTSTDDTHLKSHVSLTSIEMGRQVDAEKKFEDLLEKEQQKTFFPIDINEFHDASTDIDERMVESLPNLWSHIDSLEAEHQPRRSFDASTTSPRWLKLQSNSSSFKEHVLDIETDLDKGQLTVIDGPSLSETPESDSVSSGVGDPTKTIVVPTGTWRLWPFSFQRAPSSKSTDPSVNPSTVVDLNHTTKSISLTSDMKPDVKHKVIKKKMRTITPTSAQLESLSLKDGGNVITFTFSTAMLGKQQVDARIYLWKWNDRVVISDVDGTITKSDVLGQFMPMVGYDWSHIGVAHLFSAIKENGYQLLFLSARSISQSHLTRQFLFNLKQDGKALPDGPVVISPDGLFPSLFREVIRRAPHEFKIACLEDIKALFPTDCNPFYAGFGNRDTDEISYLRVGIPEGKIFIINPKGEVAVHRRVDTNSYSDLHTLVNGMFPVVSSSQQQEAFNSWNFWKLPPRMDFDI